MQKRIILATLISVLLMLLSLGIVSNLSIEDERRHSLSQSLELANVTANYTDYLLQLNLARLYDVSLSGAVNLQDGDWEAERQALKRAYEYSIFTDGLFLLDSDHRMVLSYPEYQIDEQDLPGIVGELRALAEERPILTGIHELKATGRKAIFAFAPLKDQQGRTVGVIGGEIDPTNSFIRNAIRSIPEGHETVIELVDHSGVVIASSSPDRVFTCTDRNQVLSQLIQARENTVLRCHRCHQEEESGSVPAEKGTDVLAFAPLQEAPWGISVREPEDAVMAASSELQRRFLLLGLIIATTALALAFGLSRSIVNPIRALTAAARRIAAGQLHSPVETDSTDEIRELTESFETMRSRLCDSLEEVRRNNLFLEERVEERTRQLEKNRRQLLNLLGRIMTAQEEERKRIARELHDETIQATAALGLSVEIAALQLKENRLSAGALSRLKSNIDQLIDGINALIRDLRPPLLDDLGMESALRALLQKHLRPADIDFDLEVSPQFLQQLEAPLDRKLKEDRELLLFRIVQEAIVNISRHSQASHAVIRMNVENGSLRVTVEDNGKGFDLQEIETRFESRQDGGFGLLGMKERVELLGGEMEIHTSPEGGGTSLRLTIPASEKPCPEFE